MKKMCKIKTLFRYCVLVFVLLFMPIANIMANEMSKVDEASRVFKDMQIGSKPVNEQITKGMPPKMDIPITLSTDIVTLIAGLIAARQQLQAHETTVIKKMVLYSQIALMTLKTSFDFYRLYELRSYTDNNYIIQNNFCQYCNKNLAERLIRNATEIYNIDNINPFKACVLDNEICNFDYTLANYGIHIYNDINNNKIIFNNAKIEESTVVSLKDFDKYSKNYNTTKMSIAMHTGCVEPFLYCKNSFCSNQQKYKTTNYNATPQNKHNNINCDEILKCPKIYGYEQYRLAISHKYKINIVKSITNKNTYDCFDEYAQYPTIYDSDS